MDKHDARQHKLSFASQRPTHLVEQEPSTNKPPSEQGDETHSDINLKELLMEETSSVKMKDMKLNILTCRLDYMKRVVKHKSRLDHFENCAIRRVGWATVNSR
ncbi:hypothetical protein NDU88_005982 [Pleurodeles waltl]|uniref:Uncharacterized protein n=1 Tax=Pleurodeles waltl TaxID=8319 RepID=A0AAV7RNN4_PLEWA|nr:hypothetical protein NDU88_005981 [Pleurodeles waltl]KAJ1153221.1 hypothetical protein NDU88_005982 [Pleurodeles waltl]